MTFARRDAITDSKVLEPRRKPNTIGGIFLRPQSAIKTPVKYSPTNSGKGSVSSNLAPIFFLKSTNAHLYTHREAKLKASEAIHHTFETPRAKGAETPKSHRT